MINILLSDQIRVSWFGDLKQYKFQKMKLCWCGWIEFQKWNSGWERSYHPPASCNR